MGPVLEDRVNRDGPQMLEEAVGRATRGHLIFREQKCSVPSNAISARWSRHWNGWRQRPGDLNRLEEQFIKRRWRGAVQHPADIVSEGIADMPNNVSQFDRQGPPRARADAPGTTGFP